MAKVLGKNYTDTPVTGGTTPTWSVPQINWSTDFRVTSEEPGETWLTNLTSPLGQPERWRFAVSTVNDVYRNSGIDPTMYYQSRRGTQLLVQLTDVFAITDDQDSAYLALAPIKAHLVLTVPNIDLITSETALSELKRLTGGLFDAKASSVNARMNSLLRGALTPASL